MAESHPEVLSELKNSFKRWFEETSADISKYRPVPVGHPERPMVDVKTQDARLYGNMKWVGNNGWIREWTDMGAYPEWDLEVRTPGVYGISILYTCARENVGVKLRVKIGEQSLTALVAEAYDPPYIGSPDRHPRNVPYEKNFRTLRAGEMKLKEGHEIMTVTLLDKPGQEAIDLESVRIELLRQSIQE